jgi:hypothetical protein
VGIRGEAPGGVFLIGAVYLRPLWRNLRIVFLALQQKSDKEIVLADIADIYKLSL